MTETLKNLAVLDLTTTSLTTLYTVPASTAALADVTFCNRSGSAVTVRLAHSPAGAAIANGHYLLYDFSVPANDSWTTPRPLKLATTDVLRVLAGTANVISVQAYGITVT